MHICVCFLLQLGSYSQKQKWRKRSVIQCMYMYYLTICR